MTKRSYILIFFSALICKVIISFIIYYHTGNQFFGGGNDSEYYHAYALGLRDDAVNIWPIILRWLNDYVYYDRGMITFLLTLLGILIIPFSAGLLISSKNKTYMDRKDYWIISTILALYPSLYFQTTDMYRDIVMLYGFILFLFCCKKLSRKSSIVTFIIAILLAYVLYKFRPYLGGACFITLFVRPIYNFRRYPILLSFIAYLVLLTILYHFNFLNRITDEYRSIFTNMEGGSNLGLIFGDTGTFIPTFLKSGLYQIIGLFFVNKPSIFVFLVESIPFLFCLIYVIKNRQFSDRFVNYLIIFFIAYTTVWLLGNDNLGSATRLRIFSYFVILVAAFIIRANKRQFISNLLPNKPN